MKSSRTEKDLQVRRVGMLALLDEMDARNPISVAGEEAGEKLWAKIESALARARTRRSSRKRTTPSSTA